MCDAASLRVLSSKVAFASPQRLSALRVVQPDGGVLSEMLFTERFFAPSGDAALAKITDAADEHKHPFICACVEKSFAALKPCEQHRIVLLQATVQ